MRPRLTALIMALAGLFIGTRTDAAGLLAPTDITLPPLRVTDHLVDVEIDDQIALTTLNQTFRNDTSRRLEATYVFPLPENADLTNFQMSFNGKMVEGKVLPADQARQIYESIVRQSKDPGLIEFIGRRLLQMRVFPIEPGSDTKITVKYQQICKPLSGMSAYHYPLRTAKTAANASDTSGGGGGGGQAYGTMRFAVKLHTTAPLKNIWSPTHSVEIVRDGENNAKIAYEAGRGSLEDDFVLLYDTDKSDLGLSVIGFKPAEKSAGHFVLTLTPKQLWPQQDYQPQDVVFVIDTSGSMAGDKIDQARKALNFCIDSLDERDRFGIVRFSTGFDALFEALAPATKDKRTEARTWVDKFTAAGGTNINDALKAALELRPVIQRPPCGCAAECKCPKSGFDVRPFVVVFITDGQGNQTAEETLKMVKGHAASPGARIFSFGVGHDVNTILLDQLATNYSGKPTYVQPGENLELVLGDFFGVISQPVLTNVKLTLPDIGATEKFPASLGDLYHGQQLILAGKFENPKTGPVKLTAMRGGKEVEYSWPSVSFANTAEAAYVPSIWAGRKVAFLIDQIRAHGENKEMIAEVAALGMEFGIQTPYTSWLVNPEQVQELARVRHVAPTGGIAPGGARPLTDLPAQRRALGAAAPGDIAGGGGGFGGGAVDTDDLLKVINNWGDAEGKYDEKAVGQPAGKAAVDFAEHNKQVRESRSKDAAGRINQSQTLCRKIGDRWYNRIGQFWVDESVDEKTRITVVKFGTNAYFELAEAKPQLRAALAASRTVVVKIDDSHAVLVSDRAGIEDFSDEQREQTGLPKRTTS